MTEGLQSDLWGSRRDQIQWASVVWARMTGGRI